MRFVKTIQSFKHHLSHQCLRLINILNENIIILWLKNKIITISDLYTKNSLFLSFELFDGINHFCFKILIQIPEDI